MTAYQNAGHYELYLYDAATERLACVSCNPSGAPATSDASIFTEGQSLHHEFPYQTRALSDDGKRVFFNTAEALVPADSNNKSDVYEWEAGQVHLISSGSGEADSSFADASASGNDVFFVTRDRLVGQDEDGSLDLYDARVGGGIAAQSPAAASPPCAGDACRTASEPAPLFASPGSQLIGVAGNVVTPASKPPGRRAKKPAKRHPKARHHKRPARKSKRRSRSAAVYVSHRVKR